MPIDTDVLIVGGGPAGLLTALHLGAKWRVTLIERSNLGNTTKYWVTSERRLKFHGVAHCARSRPPALIIGTFLGPSIRTTGDLAVVDEHALLEALIARCRDHQVELIEKVSLLSLGWSDERIFVRTTSSEYRARLVVDAAGGMSPLAKTFQLQRLDGFFAVYGAHLRNIDLHTPDVILAHIGHLGHPPPILEVIPSGDDSAYCAVFVYSRTLVQPRSLAAAFRTYCRHNDFFTVTPSTDFQEVKAGAIPIGHRYHRQLPGLVAVGEAALIQPPLLGTAFNEVLEYARPVAEHLSSVLSCSSGIPKAPNFRYPAIKRMQDRLQLQMVRRLLRGNVEAFEQLTRFAAALPGDMVYDLCSNQLTWFSLLRAATRLPWHLVRSSLHHSTDG